MPVSPEQQHRRVRRRDLRQARQRQPQRRALADDVVEVVVGLDLFLQVDVVGGEPRVQPLDRRDAGPQRRFLPAALQRDAEDLGDQPHAFDDRVRPARRGRRVHTMRAQTTWSATSTGTPSPVDDRGAPAGPCARLPPGIGTHLARASRSSSHRGGQAAAPKVAVGGRPGVHRADRLALAELDERAGLDTDGRADLLERAGDGRCDLLDVQPRELRRQRAASRSNCRSSSSSDLQPCRRKGYDLHSGDLSQAAGVGGPRESTGIAA